jgi:hypothetical protein
MPVAHSACYLTAHKRQIGEQVIIKLGQPRKVLPEAKFALDQVDEKSEHARHLGRRPDRCERM